MVVTNLKWAVLAWPVVARGNLWILDPHGCLSWHFAVRPGQYESFDPQPSLKDNCGFGVDISSAMWEPMIQSMLRTCSPNVAMAELSLLARSMNLDTRGLKKRADLVHHLALHVGDEDFAKIVMENEQKNARGSNKADVDESDEEGEAMDDDLAELILGELGDEAAEFRDIKKRLQDRHAIKKKRKWAEWRKASDEVFWF